jgi:hypothetical protein
VNPAERDVVYICRTGEDNEELRHSLRSVAAHLPHRRVWIVGYRPAWVADDVGYVPVLQRGPKHSNTWGNWVAAARCASLSDEFVLMNDDFFITRPIDDVPNVHRGPLDEMVDWYARNRLTSHRQRAAVTRQVLRRAGRTEGLLSYELHVPMVVNRHALADGVRMIASSTTPGHGVAKRTFYGNLAGLGGTRERDVKAMSARDAMPETPLPFVSTSPHSWAGLVGGWVRQRFAEPCAYERVPSGTRTYQPPGRSAPHVR